MTAADVIAAPGPSPLPGVGGHPAPAYRSPDLSTIHQPPPAAHRLADVEVHAHRGRSCRTPAAR